MHTLSALNAYYHLIDWWAFKQIFYIIAVFKGVSVAPWDAYATVICAAYEMYFYLSSAKFHTKHQTIFRLTFFLHFVCQLWKVGIWSRFGDEFAKRSFGFTNMYAWERESERARDWRQRFLPDFTHRNSFLKYNDSAKCAALVRCPFWISLSILWFLSLTFFYHRISIYSNDTFTHSHTHMTFVKQRGAKKKRAYIYLNLDNTETMLSCESWQRNICCKSVLFWIEMFVGIVLPGKMTTQIYLHFRFWTIKACKILNLALQTNFSLVSCKKNWNCSVWRLADHFTVGDPYSVCVFAALISKQ